MVSSITSGSVGELQATTQHRVLLITCQGAGRSSIFREPEVRYGTTPVPEPQFPTRRHITPVSTVFTTAITAYRTDVFADHQLVGQLGCNLKVICHVQSVLGYRWECTSMWSMASALPAVRSCGSAVLAGRSAGSFLANSMKSFSSLKYPHRLGGTCSLSRNRKGGLLLAWRRPAMQFTVDLHLVPRLIMSGCISLLRLYVLLDCTGRTLHIPSLAVFVVGLWNLVSWAEDLRLGVFETRMQKCVGQSKGRLDKLHKNSFMMYAVHRILFAR
jgi:hypothetical protein